MIQVFSLISWVDVYVFNRDRKCRRWGVWRVLFWIDCFEMSVEQLGKWFQSGVKGIYIYVYICIFIYVYIQDFLCIKNWTGSMKILYQENINKF